jgi:HEAT repeat protein
LCSAREEVTIIGVQTVFDAYGRLIGCLNYREKTTMDRIAGLLLAGGLYVIAPIGADGVDEITFHLGWGKEAHTPIEALGRAIQYDNGTIAKVLAAEGLPQEDRRDPRLDLQELEALLAQAEKGGDVDLEKVAALVPSSRKTCPDQPGDEGGLAAWSQLTEELARKYPRTVQQLIRRGVYGADRFVFGLGKAGGEKNVDFLSRLLDERLARLEALKARGVKEDEDPDWQLHMAIVLALGRTRSKEAWPALNRALSCVFMNVSGNAMLELAAAGDMGLVPTIGEWLESKDERRQSAAVGAIVSLATDGTRRELSEKLLEKLRRLEKSGVKRQELARAMLSLGDETALQVVHDMALDESEYLHGLKLLEECPDPWRGRYPPTNYGQNRALDAIAKPSSPRSLPVLDQLAKQAKDKNIRKRATAIAAEIRRRQAERKQLTP